jgi:hypothetical protein
MSGDIHKAGVGEQYPCQPILLKKLIIFGNNIKRLAWVLFTHASMWNITTFRG